MNSYLLKLKCPDKGGIVATISTALFEMGANITSTSEFSELQTQSFCMRTVFDADFASASEVREALTPALEMISAEAIVRSTESYPNVALMVSKHDHCLVDLLYRTKNGELPINVPVVVSNHEDLRHEVESFGAEFVYAPVTTETKAEAERKLREAIDKYKIDLVVLARYMQIISADLSRDLNGRLINIHHSFLPGFKGARPFEQAWERGVKMIGATAHFVTEDLDEGPIISQGVTEISHRDSAEDIKLKSKDVERLVLAKAVDSVAQAKVFLCDKKTVVLD